MRAASSAVMPRPPVVIEGRIPAAAGGSACVAEGQACAADDDCCTGLTCDSSMQCS
jgi:hypothetical protein